MRPDAALGHRLARVCSRASHLPSQWIWKPAWGRGRVTAPPRDVSMMHARWSPCRQWQTRKPVDGFGAYSSHRTAPGESSFPPSSVRAEPLPRQWAATSSAARTGNWPTALFRGHAGWPCPPTPSSIQRADGNRVEPSPSRMFAICDLFQRILRSFLGQTSAFLSPEASPGGSVRRERPEPP